jgi:hypothetical protein
LRRVDAAPGKVADKGVPAGRSHPETEGGDHPLRDAAAAEGVATDGSRLAVRQEIGVEGRRQFVELDQALAVGVELG